MRPRCFSSVAVVLAGLVPVAVVAADGPFAELARHVPETANALVLVNVQKLFSRPLAQKEGWREDAEKRIAGGLTTIPMDASQCLLAAQLDFRTMRPAWQVGLVQMDAAPTLATLARQHGGAIDTVGSRPGLRLPDDSYLVRFSEHTLGGFTPGDRQAVSRWTRSAENALSPSLQEAIRYADAGAEIIMALDLSDVAALEDVQQGLQALDDPQLEAAKLDLKELAQLLVGVKSLMLGMTFDQRPFGKIKLEFDRDVSVPANVVKPLLLAVVAQRGLMLDEFADWKAEVAGRRIMFGGFLTSSGLTRLSSLVDLPSGAFHNLREVPRLAGAKVGAIPGLQGAAASEASTGKATPTPPVLPKPEVGPGTVAPKPENHQDPAAPAPKAGPPQDAAKVPGGPNPVPPPTATDPAALPTIVRATRQYFRSTGQLLRDLRGRKNDAKTIGQIGAWYEMYARRVDRLPLLNVDDEMLSYGGHVANQLRNASLSIKGAGIRTHVGKATAVNQGVPIAYRQTFVTYGAILRDEVSGVRGLTPAEKAAVIRQVRAEERGAAATSYQQIEMEIDAATAEVRVAMTKKYKAEF